MAPKSDRQWVLPDLILSPSNALRARRELAALEEYLQAQRLRPAGTATGLLPKVSRVLESFVTGNAVNLLQPTDRADLATYLETVLQAPVVHISFAAEPSFAALQQITLWLRRAVQADVLVRVGIQPNIVAGCVVRTTNKYFDFSLRHRLDEQRGYLLEALQDAQP